MSDETNTINTSSEESEPADTRKPVEPRALTTSPPIDLDVRYDTSKVPTIAQEQYELGQEFARGGMGRILRAVDLRVGREVALKESLGANGKMLARFYREAMVTARLQHPGIVPIYELGRWPSGEPFYSMRFVKGLPLEDTIKENMSLRDRIALLDPVISACEALAYAHSQKIVHRDLKPANILCGAFGETVVIDWGIAKDLQNSEPEINDDEDAPQPQPASNKTSSKTSLTMAGAVMGTPVYMPPEQAHGLPIDERADVYSLGAILYEVLSGRPPYKGKTAQLILMDLIEKPPTPLAEVQQGIPRDLVAIVEKAMARDAKDRYRNAGELANELRKFQTGQIVDAYQYSNWELVKRFVGRYLLTFIVGGVAALILAASLIYSYLQISQARDVAVEQSIGRAKEAVQLAIQLSRTSLDTDPAQSLRYLREASRSPYFDSWDSLRVIAADAISRGVPRLLTGTSKPLSDATLSADGSMLAAAAEDGSVQVWQMPEGKLLTTFPPGEGARKTLAFSLDGKLLAASYGARLRLWAPTGGVSRAIVAPANINALAFSPDGASLVLACEDGSVGLYETASGDLKKTFDTVDVPTSVASKPGLFSRDVFMTTLTRLLFSRDGKLLVGAGAEKIFLWEVASEDGRYAKLWQDDLSVLPGQDTGDINALTLSPDGGTIAVAQGKQLHLLSISWLDGHPTLSSSPRLEGHEWPIYALAFSPDGSTIASASEDRSIRIWRTSACASSACQPEVLSKHRGSVLGLAFSSDGRTLLSSSRDRTIRMWDMTTLKESGTLRGHRGEVKEALFSNKDQTIISIGDEPSVFLWDIRQIGTRSFVGHQDAVFSLRFSPDGKSIVTVGKDKTARLWDVSCESPNFSLYCDKNKIVKEAYSSMWDVFFSRDGKTLYAAVSDGDIAFLSVESGAVEALLKGHREDVYALDLSPNGALLASAGKDKTVRIWDISTKEQKTLLEGHTDAVLDVSFSMDQRFVASASQDGTVRVWDVASGKEVFKSSGAYNDQYSSVSFSPDGETLALAGYSSKIQLFSFLEGRLTPEAILSQHQGEIERITFSRDGKTLASASWDGTARLWSLTDKNFESRALVSHGKDVTGVDFSPDGSLFAFVSEDKQLHIAPNTLSTKKEELRAWLEGLDLD